MVFSPWLFCTDSSTVRWPLYRARLSMLLRAVDHVGHLAQSLTGTVAPAARDDDVAKVARHFSRALTCTTRSCSAADGAQRQFLVLAAQRAATDLVDAQPGPASPPGAAGSDLRAPHRR
jgi:hypothetical protein